MAFVGTTFATEQEQRSIEEMALEQMPVYKKHQNKCFKR
jgi:hypothetical protein